MDFLENFVLGLRIDMYKDAFENIFINQLVLLSYCFPSH